MRRKEESEAKGREGMKRRCGEENWNFSNYHSSTEEKKKHLGEKTRFHNSAHVTLAMFEHCQKKNNKSSWVMNSAVDFEAKKTIIAFQHNPACPQG